MKYKLIVFEGVDGSGKTVLAKEMAKQINGIYYYSPPKLIRPFRWIADNLPSRLRYFFYLFGNYILSIEIRYLLKNKNIVCDWYYYSTIAYHSILLKKNLKVSSLPEPDFIIHTIASWSEIDKRLSARRITGKHSDISFLKKVSKKYDEIFKNKNNVIKISTTGKNPITIIKQLRQKLNLKSRSE